MLMLMLIWVHGLVCGTVAGASGDASSIAAQMRQLKERAAQPIEERMAASLNAPGVSRSVCGLGGVVGVGVGVGASSV